MINITYTFFFCASLEKVWPQLILIPLLMWYQFSGIKKEYIFNMEEIIIKWANNLLNKISMRCTKLN